ncbi:unnamed protein product [Rotaria sordida]|uniref:Cation-transporting P-type ATPase N-terminal domain-containing protein n=1 Tax=Rotaria sordida TaxID=392033 RepID=A0A819LF64_9BILA|nr:unnamed protein product [Rotaria sordida]CAF1087858.1 unnamed protein product [Rotaria sordida]CAF1370451.1 unnamed protein product [Rotaria sordida]CAF3963786.1 unnamed protein product [Rotaria sordida]
MSLFKHKSATNEDVAGGGDCSMFGLTLDQLKELIQLRGKELMEKLNSSDYNGVEGVLEKLKVDKNKGLDSNNQQDLEQRRIAYGKNQIPRKQISHIPLTSAWRREHQFRHAVEESDKTPTSVLRDKRIQQIPVIELVVGDLCFIKSGDFLPADGLIVQANDLKVDQSSITGETDLIKKNQNEDVALFSGTEVKEGNGQMVVIGVGPNSYVGYVVSLLQAPADS